MSFYTARVTSRLMHRSKSPYSITSSARNKNDSGILWLELRGFGNKLAELIRRVTTHSCGPRIA
jgi:hypothetical protein